MATDSAQPATGRRRQAAPGLSVLHAEETAGRQPTGGRPPSGARGGTLPTACALPLLPADSAGASHLVIGGPRSESCAVSFPQELVGVQYLRLSSRIYSMGVAQTS